MTLVVLAEAKEELTAAAEWYENERLGLGDDLLAEVARALKQIAANPMTWPIVLRGRGVRRFVVTRFPYVVYYVVRDEQVRVLAFAHTSRKPGYWRTRVAR
jgi:plasmid stabilization system protein ParE